MRAWPRPSSNRCADATMTCPVLQGGRQMRRQIAAALCAAALGAIALSSSSLAQQKTAKACAEEWQGDKTASRANRVTERAYVARCRADAAKAASDRQVYSSVKDLME